MVLCVAIELSDMSSIGAKVLGQFHTISVWPTTEFDILHKNY